MDLFVLHTNNSIPEYDVFLVVWRKYCKAQTAEQTINESRLIQWRKDGNEDHPFDHEDGFDRVVGAVRYQGTGYAQCS